MFQVERGVSHPFGLRVDTRLNSCSHVTEGGDLSSPEQYEVPAASLQETTLPHGLPGAAAEECPGAQMRKGGRISDEPADRDGARGAPEGLITKDTQPHNP